MIERYWKKIKEAGYAFTYLSLLFFFKKDIRQKNQRFLGLYRKGKEPKKANGGGGRVVFVNDCILHMGLADRLKGILTFYQLSKKHRRPFYIHWTLPYPLTDYLVPANYDWRIDSSEISFDTRYTLPVKTLSNTRGNHINKLIIEGWLKRSRKDIHVVSNWPLYEDLYPKLFNELFRPSPLLEEALRPYEAKGRYYSYTFRFMRLLGDFEDVRGDILDEDEREKLIQKNLKELKKLMESLPKGYKALVTSDSGTFLSRVEGSDSRIFTVPGNRIHPVAFFHHREKVSVNPDSFLKSFVDFFLIMRAEKVYALTTDKMYNTGFPKVAAKIGNKPFIRHNF